MERNGLSSEAVLQRIDAQMSLDEKCRRATYVVRNTGTLDELRDEVQAIHSKLVSSKSYWKLRIAVGIGLSLMAASVAFLSSKI